jgi:hypothetical protein
MIRLLSGRHAVKRVCCRLTVSVNPRVTKVITSLAPVVDMPRVLLPGASESPREICHEEVFYSAGENLKGNCLEIFLHRIPHLPISGGAALVFDLPAGSHQT